MVVVVVVVVVVVIILIFELLFANILANGIDAEPAVIDDANLLPFDII